MLVKALVGGHDELNKLTGHVVTLHVGEDIGCGELHGRGKLLVPVPGDGVDERLPDVDGMPNLEKVRIVGRHLLRP